MISNEVADRVVELYRALIKSTGHNLRIEAINVMDNHVADAKTPEDKIKVATAFLTGFMGLPYVE